MILKPLMLAMTLQLKQGDVGGITCLQPSTLIVNMAFALDELQSLFSLLTRIRAYILQGRDYYTSNSEMDRYRMFNANLYYLGNSSKVHIFCPFLKFL